MSNTDFDQIFSNTRQNRTSRSADDLANKRKNDHYDDNHEQAIADRKERLASSKKHDETVDEQGALAHSPTTNDNNFNSVNNGAANTKIINRELYQSNLKAGVVFIDQIKQSISPPKIGEMANLESWQLAMNPENQDPANQLGQAKVTVLNKNQLIDNMAAATVFMPPILMKTSSNNYNLKSITADDKKIGKNNQLIIDELASNTPNENNLITNKLSPSEMIQAQLSGGGGSGKEDFDNTSAKDNSATRFLSAEFSQQSQSSSADNILGSPSDANKLKFAQNLDSFLPKVKSTLSNGGTQLKIKLNPENLGSLEFKLSKDNGKITAELLTDNMELSEHLKHQIDKVRQNLAEQGIKLDNLVIKYNPVEDFAGNSNFNSEQQSSSSFTKNSNNQTNDPKTLESQTNSINSTSRGRTSKSNRIIDLHI